MKKIRLSYSQSLLNITQDTVRRLLTSQSSARRQPVYRRPHIKLPDGQEESPEHRGFSIIKKKLMTMSRQEYHFVRQVNNRIERFNEEREVRSRGEMFLKNWGDYLHNNSLLPQVKRLVGKPL